MSGLVEKKKREKTIWRDEKCVVVTRDDNGMKRPGWWCCASSFDAHAVEALTCCGVVVEAHKMEGNMPAGGKILLLSSL